MKRSETIPKLFKDMTIDEKIVHIEFMCRDARKYMLDNEIYDAEILDLVDRWLPFCIGYIKEGLDEAK